VPERPRDLPLTERRILVYGVTGSGKSTAATRLGAATGLPVHLADELTWLPGWVPVDDEVQRERFAEIVAGDDWVLDTAYATWRDLVLARCELVVGLDYPRWRSLARLVRRTLTRLVDRRPICNGNVETVRNLVSRDSIVAWHFTSFARKRDRMRAWAASDDVPILLFRRPVELERWLASLESDVDRSSPAPPTRGPGR
jgi:adenylate kinase family enzyme